MARKKNSGTGSVYYNKERKNWTASYTIIDTETKQEKRVRKTFSTEEEAKRYLQIIQYQKGNEIFIKNNGIPIFELMKLIHKRKLDTNQIGIVAYNRLQSTLNVIDKSEVAHKDINTVTSEELQDYFNTLTYYSNSYISKIIEQFSQAFKYAMNKGFLLANPMYDTIVPKSTRQDKIIRALDIDEQQKLTTYLVNSFTDFEPYKNAFLIELYMGLRIGEVLSLKKEHIDLRRNLITVNTTMTRDEAGMRAVALKELMGHSDVSITLNVYASVFNKYKNSELEKVNNYYMNNEIFKNEPKVLEIEHNSDFTPMNFGQELDCGDER